MRPRSLGIGVHAAVAHGSDALIGFGDLLSVAAPAAPSAPVTRPVPAVAVLTAGAPPQPAAAAVALALAAVCRTRAALVACVAAPPPANALRTPASVTAATRLRRDGVPAHAVGRLVWLFDSPVTETSGSDAPDAPDAPGGSDAAARDRSAATQALAALLAAAAQRCGLPAVIGVGGPRSDALDRTLASRHGIVVVLPRELAPPLAEATLESLARLGPPAAAMPAPRRLDAAGALCGLRAPRAAADAVAALGLRRAAG